MAKLSLDDLRKLREDKKGDLRKREVDGKEMQIVVGVGTCGIAAGAKPVLDAFIVGLDKNNLVDTCFVRQTGCMGLCHSEPTVEVIVPGMPSVIYGNVNEKVVEDIIQKHLIGKELLSGHILDRPAIDIISK